MYEKLLNMSTTMRSAQDILSLREDIFSLNDADRDTMATILYFKDPSVGANSTDINDVGINLEELSDDTFRELREYVNCCLLRIRKELEIRDLGRDIMMLPGKFNLIFLFLIERI